MPCPREILTGRSLGYDERDTYSSVGSAVTAYTGIKFTLLKAYIFSAIVIYIILCKGGTFYRFLSVKTEAIDWNCLFRRFHQFVAFQMIHNSLQLCNNIRKECKLCKGNK
jgi:hypothetical protein